MFLRYRMIVLHLFCLLGTQLLFATTIEEYNELIFQLQNYNTPGFTIFYLNDLNKIDYERGAIINAEESLCLSPYKEGLFQFFDRRREEICYARNSILLVDVFGRICNIDWFPLVPEIKVDTSKSYNITFSEKDMKIIIHYQDEINSTEEHRIDLYWPQTLSKAVESGDYFYFKDVKVLEGSKILSGFFENSATNVQVVIAKMMKLISELENQYGDSLVFHSGSFENTLSILNALLISSSYMKLEPAIVFHSNEISELEFESPWNPETTIKVPINTGPRPNVDPLKINHLIEYLIIEVNP